MKPDFEFGQDGAFTFLHLTDLHEEDEANPRAYGLLREQVAARRPSLLVVTGDLTFYGNRKGEFEERMSRFVEVVRELHVPVCLTFGNHDSEFFGQEFWSRREQYGLYRSWLGDGLFVDHDVAGLEGVGSGVVRIRRRCEAESAFNLFVMDSGSYSHKDPETGAKLAVPWKWGWDGCRTRQIAWYEHVSGTTPCLWFQHVVVPDANDTGLFVEAAEGDPGVEMAFHGGIARLKPAAGVLGELNGRTCGPPWEAYRDAAHTHEGRTLYESWLRMGNLRGAYFGHDHYNSFDGTDRNGIRLGMTKSFTMGELNAGAPYLRVFTVHPDGLFETELVTDSLARA